MNIFYKLTMVFAVICMTIPTLAQRGPAGVGAAAENQIWLDATTLNHADGDPVNFWGDKSENGENFTSVSADRFPIYSSTGMNGMPALTFDGYNDVLFSGAIPELDSESLTFFMVYQKTTMLSDMLITSKYASASRKWETYAVGGYSTLFGAQYSPTRVSTSFVGSGAPSFYSQHMTPTAISMYNQGVHGGTTSGAYTVPSGHQNVVLANKRTDGFGGYVFGGLVSELIVFNTSLNDLERVLVENYLGAKYNMAIPTDLYDYEATHSRGVIGIGNDGTNVHNESTGDGILTISSPDDMGSGEYLLVGHDNQPIDEYNTENLPPILLALEYERMQRQWRIDETGDVGTLNFSFDLSAPGLDFGIPDDYFILIDSDGDGDFTNATVAIPTDYDGVNKTVSADINVTAGTLITIAAPKNSLDINSVTTGNWSNPSTWDCTCIPTTLDNVTIFNGDEVFVDTDGFMTNLNVDAGATLTMDEDFTLNISGNWEITGETNFNDGTIAFVGEINQNVNILSESEDTVRLNNVVLNNTAGGTITFEQQNYILHGTLSPNAGHLVIDPSTNFVIASTSATEGGRVGPIMAGSTITGQFNVQRFIPAGIAGWRDLASPVIGATFNGWDPDLPMSGDDFPDGCAWGPDGCFHSVTYNEDDVLIDVTSSSDPIVNGRGYEIFVGNTMTSWDGGTLNSLGTLNASGNLDFSFGSGWSTIGNPYASPISFSSVGLSGGIGEYFYVYDPSSGGFEWYDGTSGTSSIPEITENGLMATGQAVWIFSSGAGTVTFSQANKVEGNATYIRGHEENNALMVTLKENASTYHCVAQLEEKSLAQDGLEDDMDLRQLIQPHQDGPSLAFEFEEGVLRKNFIAPDGRDKSFQLDVKIKNTGLYTISADNWANFRNYRHIYLYDAETNQTIDLKSESYVFHADADAEEDLSDISRFTLILTNGEGNHGAAFAGINEVEMQSGTVVINQMGHVIDIAVSEEEVGLSTITITNVLGQTEVHSIQTSLINGSNIITLPEHLKGFHIISVKTENQIVNKKVIL